MGCGCNAVAARPAAAAASSQRGRACLSCSPFSSLTVLRVQRTACGQCRLVPCRPFAERIDGCRCACPVWPAPAKPACCKEEVVVKTVCKCKKPCGCTAAKHCGCKADRHEHDDDDGTADDSTNDSADDSADDS